MRPLFICLLLLPAFGWAQDKPLFHAVKQAEARITNKADVLPDLFTANGSEKATQASQSPNQLIYKLKLNPAALTQIRQERREFLEISVPTAEGPVELALVSTNIFAPGFTVKTSAPDSNFRFDASKFLFYQGVLKNNPNSVVALMLTDDEITATIADSTGNRVLAKKRDKATAATDYALYNEKAVAAETRPFSCGTDENIPARVPAKQGPANGARASATTNSACVKYVGIYFEADNALYQYYNGDSDALTADILYLFDQVVTLYRNESIYVQISGLKIWNSTDPYASATSTIETFNQFRSNGRSAGNSFPGQLAHLLSSRHFSDFGGYAWIGGLTDRQNAYGVSVNILPNYANLYPTYSYYVSTVTHELGHNFGSQHTQWCGWDLGNGTHGALDNCAPTEGGCPPGPAPDNGGTIMSYCGSNTNFTKGFGPLPGNVIRTTINNTSLPITTSDNGLQSVASGSWTTGSTWVCGLLPSVIYDVSISNGNTVPLNTSGNAKSLNINGIFDLSTTSSVINIPNN